MWSGRKVAFSHVVSPCVSVSILTWPGMRISSPSLFASSRSGNVRHCAEGQDFSAVVLYLSTSSNEVVVWEDWIQNKISWWTLSFFPGALAEGRRDPETLSQNSKFSCSAMVDILGASNAKNILVSNTWREFRQSWAAKLPPVVGINIEELRIQTNLNRLASPHLRGL